MLTRIRNANNAKHETVDVPASNMKKSIAQILLDEGSIQDIAHPREFRDTIISAIYEAAAEQEARARQQRYYEQQQRRLEQQQEYGGYPPPPSGDFGGY